MMCPESHFDAEIDVQFLDTILRFIDRILSLIDRIFCFCIEFLVV